ncbi:hypothetical protein [Chrysosporum bergii]|uniref:hypothetical protein n=1 Tax=Chrysosporum bergii TaxID=105352 RepID=UPI0031452B76
MTKVHGIFIAASSLLHNADSEIGLDVGLEYFDSDFNGHHEPNPRFIIKAENPSNTLNVESIPQKKVRI